MSDGKRQEQLKDLQKHIGNACLYLSDATRVASQLEMWEAQQELLKVEQAMERVKAIVSNALEGQSR